MRLSDFLVGVGRPVAYYPGMARALGDMKESVFVCQMAYWKDKGDDPEGWIYKTAEEIEQETALSYKEQTGARDGLKGKGLLEEYYARTEHKMYFRVNWDAVNNLWDEYSQKEHLTKSKMPKHPPESKVAPSKKSSGSLPKVSSLNSNTETTAKTTTDIIKGASLDWKLAHGQTPSEEELRQAKLKDEAPKMFERAFGFGTLPWVSNKAWQKFQTFITDIYTQDQLAFGNYIVWRGGAGKYKAMSNKQIRMNPQMFIDTGWMEFVNQVQSTPPVVSTLTSWLAKKEAEAANVRPS